MRREYELTEEQLARLLEASKPVPYIVVGGMPPSSPQANANRAWEALGREMGFEHWTVEPVSGKGQRCFTAHELAVVAPAARTPEEESDE